MSAPVSSVKLEVKMWTGSHSWRGTLVRDVEETEGGRERTGTESSGTSIPSGRPEGLGEALGDSPPTVRGLGSRPQAGTFP